MTDHRAVRLALELARAKLRILELEQQQALCTCPAQHHRRDGGESDAAAIRPS